MPDPLLIFPFGGNAREAAALILSDHQLSQQWNMIGFMDDNKAFQGKEYSGIKVLETAEALEKYPRASVLAVIGNPNNYLKRQQIIGKLNLSEKRLAAVVHSSVAIAPEADIGRNVLIGPNVVIGAGASVGHHCIILANTVISHDVKIGDYGCVGANVTVSGGVIIQENCYIGSGTNIKENLTIGQRSLVGLGAVVIKDVPADSVLAGNPARELARK